MICTSVQIAPEPASTRASDQLPARYAEFSGVVFSDDIGMAAAETAGGVAAGACPLRCRL